MKVWELMAKLAKCKAGDDVFVQRGEATHMAPVSGFDDSLDDAVAIFGDGSSSEDDDVEN